MRHVAVLAALLLAAPLPLSAQTAGPSGTGAGAGATAAITGAAEYLAAAAAGDLYEMTSSELVLRGEGGSDEVRGFAQKMVADHQNASVQFRAAAEAAGLRLGVPVMTPQQQAMITALQAVEGAQRERVYLAQQVTAHRQSLALHQGYAKDGDRADLRAQARMAAQVVEGHLLELQRLMSGR